MLPRVKRIWILASLVIWVGVFSPFTAVQSFAAEAKFSDIHGHWAQNLIEHAVTKGYVTGYEDGTFRPDEPVTVAEFVTMVLFSLSDDRKTLSQTYLNKVNKYFKAYTLENFSLELWQDGSSQWYSNYIRQGRILGILNSDDFGGNFETKMKREDVAFLADNIVGLMFDGGIDHTVYELVKPEIKDFERVSLDRTSQVLMSYYRGIMVGDGGGWFNPDRYVSRSEAIAVIERIHDESLRTPYKVDFSIYPHVVVKNDQNATQHDVIFASEKAKQKYLTMVEVAEQTNQFVLHNGQNIMIFENEDAYKLYVNQISDYTKWNDSHHYDLLLLVGEFGKGVVNLSISTIPGRFERVKRQVNEFVRKIMGENSDALITLINKVCTKKDEYRETSSLKIGDSKVMYQYELSAEVVSFTIVEQ